jgi:hypothetical protein
MIHFSFPFSGNGHINKNIKELLIGVDLFNTILKDNDSLTLIKRKIDNFLMMAQDQNLLNFIFRQGYKLQQAFHFDSLIDFGNRNQLFID